MSIKWTSDDVGALQRFLDDNPKFLEALKSKRPPLVEGSQEEVAFRAVRVKGYEDALFDIQEMARIKSILD